MSASVASTSSTVLTVFICSTSLRRGWSCKTVRFVAPPLSTRPPRRRAADRGRRAVRRAPRPGSIGRRRRRSRARTQEHGSSLRSARPCSPSARLRPSVPAARGRSVLPAGRAGGRSRRGSSAPVRRYGRRSALETSERLNFAGELCTRADAELGIDMGQVAGYCSLPEEERGGDFSIRATFRDERGDTALRGGQPLLARPSADRPKLVTCLFHPGGGAELFKGLERGLDRVARRALLPRAPADDPEREQRPSATEGI